MNTEHILFYPHKEYNTEKEMTDNLRNKDYIQYGYIKLRDLNKWLNNEVVSVKMGMLTPSNKSYRGLTILESVIKRIKEQDTTALFDDEDELIPIYVFVSTETDDEWRNYLLSNGFVSSRKNANREGIKIKKSDIGLHYGLHYNVNTDEVLTEKERKIKEKNERISSSKFQDVVNKIIQYKKNGYETEHLYWDTLEEFSLIFKNSKIYFGHSKWTDTNKYYSVTTDIADLEFSDLDKILYGLRNNIQLHKEHKLTYLQTIIAFVCVFLIFGIPLFTFNTSWIGSIINSIIIVFSGIGILGFSYSLLEEMLFYKKWKYKVAFWYNFGSNIEQNN